MFIEIRREVDGIVEFKKVLSQKRKKSKSKFQQIIIPRWLPVRAYDRLMIYISIDRSKRDRSGNGALNNRDVGIMHAACGLYGTCRERAFIQLYPNKDIAGYYCLRRRRRRQVWSVGNAATAVVQSILIVPEIISVLPLQPPCTDVYCLMWYDLPQRVQTFVEVLTQHCVTAVVHDVSSAQCAHKTTSPQPMTAYTA